MKSTFKKFASLFLALAMVCSLAVPAFAAEEADTITVTITLQRWDKTMTGSTPEAIPGFSTPVTVTIEKGQTVKDAVNALAGVEVDGEALLELVTCEDEDAYGCVQTNGQCACTANGGVCNCTWKKVENVDPETYAPLGTYSSVLNSMNLYDEDNEEGRALYTNNGGSVENADGTHTYTGEAWEYYVESTYPEEQYMSQYVLNENAGVTLSFTKSSFNW